MGLLGGGLLGAVSAYRLAYGVAALLAAVLGVVIVRRPAHLAVVALCGVFAVQRLGTTSLTSGGAGGVSYTDAMLTAAAFLAIPAVFDSPEIGRLRLALLGLGAYLSCLLPSVILHASSRVCLEWTHRLVLVGGALIVGAWIAREGLTRVALRWLTLIACIVALLAIANSARNGWAPATPIGFNKNFLGAMFGPVLVLVALASRVIGLTLRVQVVAVLVLAAGLLSSQSRGGMLAASAGLLVAFALDSRGEGRRARTLSAVVAIVLATFAFVSIRNQLRQTTENPTTSLGVRFNVEKVTRDVWRTSPVTGVGMKYFNTGKYGPFAQAANNDVDNELAESGVIGLIGFIALQGSVLIAGVRRRRDRPLLAAATGVVAAVLLHGMVDIYWTAGAVTLPFILLGMALGAEPAAEESSR